jgi:hypothetical protein
MALDLYNCKVRLHGDVRDEVRKRNVTAGEIRIFRLIHGEDAVLDVVKTGHKAMSAIPGNEGAHRGDDEERDRLSRFYGEKIVAKLYGAKPISLSEEIKTFEDFPDEEVKTYTDQPLPLRRGRPRKEDVIGA